MSGLARTQVHALESRQHAQRSLERPRLREVEFNHFISRHCARVLHVDFYRDRIAALTLNPAIFRLLYAKLV